MQQCFKGRTAQSRDDLETPAYFFRLLDNEFHLTLDPPVLRSRTTNALSILPSWRMAWKKTGPGKPKNGATLPLAVAVFRERRQAYPKVSPFIHKSHGDESRL
ncbi:MAG: hypothetical protein RBG13Loki_0609 [Promethearchaeota archaeon CR_4]|nr:MAG: hypothetical protein RBG13Loki_0609 [Candidatus Lokiarchaeota archaeon CR_4]